MTVRPFYTPLFDTPEVDLAVDVERKEALCYRCGRVRGTRGGSEPFVCDACRSFVVRRRTP